MKNPVTSSKAPPPRRLPWIFLRLVHPLAALLIVSPFAPAQNLQWARNMGGTAADHGHGIAVDGADNVYSAGYFNGTADFDPGSGTYNMTSAGISDVFISKLDASGNFVWAGQLGGTADDIGYAIAVDNSGLVVTGYFEGTADFDPGSGTYNLTSTGGRDIFICKLSLGGNLLWAVQFGSAFSEQGRAITIGSSGDIYTTGFFAGTIDFDPGAGSFNLSSTGGSDVFISVLTSSGGFLTALRMGGAGMSVGRGLAVDSSGSIYVCGYFAATVDFDPGATTYNLTALVGEDGFVAKLNASGGFQWAISIPGNSAVQGDQAFGVVPDSQGNVHVTGRFWGTADFDPGPGVFNLVSAGTADIFILKLDASGGLVWAKRIGSNNGDEGNSIALDSANNVYTTGHFSLTVDFDPGPGTYNLNAAASYEIFVCKLDAGGNFVWAVQLGNVPAGDIGWSIVVKACDVYTAGAFLNTADFDPGPGVFYLIAAGTWDAFVCKLDCGLLLPIQTISFEVLAEEETRSALCAWETSADLSCDRFEVQRSSDGSAFASIGVIPLSSASNCPVKQEFTDEEPLPGISYYRLCRKDHRGMISYSPVRRLVMPDEGVIRLDVISGRAPITYLISASESSEGVLAIFDATGRRVWSSEITFIEGITRREIDVHLRAGIYHIVLQHAGCQEASASFVVL